MSNQNGKEKRKEIPTMICNDFTRSKGVQRAIDFRDALTTPTSLEHYAKIHSAKGKPEINQYPSQIQVWVTNSGNGQSASATANISPALPQLWLEICKQNIGISVLPMYRAVYGPNYPREKEDKKMVESTVGSLVKSIQANSRIGRALVYLIEDKLESLEYRLKENLDRETIDEYPNQMDALRKAIKALRSKDVQPLYAIRYPRKVDYTYSDTRVHTHREANGFAPVRVINVSHGSVLDNQKGDLLNSPWKFEIRNFEAKPKRSKKGLTQYIAGTERNMKYVSINLSEMQMFELMYRVTRYIELWEIANCLPFIREGSQHRHELVQAYVNDQKQGQQQQASQYQRQQAPQQQRQQAPQRQQVPQQQWQQAPQQQGQQMPQQQRQQTPQQQRRQAPQQQRQQAPQQQRQQAPQQQGQQMPQQQRQQLPQQQQQQAPQQQGQQMPQQQRQQTPQQQRQQPPQQQRQQSYQIDARDFELQ